MVSKEDKALLVHKALENQDHRGLKGHRASRGRRDPKAKASQVQREKGAKTGQGVLEGGPESASKEIRVISGLLGLQVHSAHQELESKERRVQRDQGGFQGCVEYQGRGSQDQRGTRACLGRLDLLGNEGQENLDQRVNQGHLGLLGYLVCQERTEPLVRRENPER